MRELLAVLLVSAFSLPAATDDNANLWFVYNGDHPLGKSRWGLHLEGHLRRTDLGLKWQQYLLRPALNFQLHPKIQLSGGYTFLNTYRFGSFPPPTPVYDHRFHEQVSLSHRLLRLDLQHRLRFEQRSIAVLAQNADGGFHRTAFRYENRFRYQLRSNIPLRRGGGKYYLALADEIFFNYGENVAANVFDQNRVYVALGRNLSRFNRLELGYMEQTVQRRDGQLFLHNHTVQLTFVSRKPFFLR